MDIEVVEQTKNKIVLKIIGETHAFCNLLRHEIAKDKNVIQVGYQVPTPLKDESIFILTVEKGDPLSILKKAVQSVIKKIELAKAQAEKLFG
ncbi:MAG: DNA-directed RNA polymerase subunit L [Candidatus Korarchaeota archaeon]